MIAHLDRGAQHLERGGLELGEHLRALPGPARGV
jgi:hypothetical protein